MWYCDGDQMIEEFIYMVIVQGYFGIYWYVVMNMEVCDGVFCYGGYCFLVCDCSQIGLSGFSFFGVFNSCMIIIDVQNDFVQFRDLYVVFVIEFFFQSGMDGVCVLRFQMWCVGISY